MFPSALPTPPLKVSLPDGPPPALQILGCIVRLRKPDVSARRNLAALLGRSTPLIARVEDELLARLGPARGMLYFYGLAWRHALQGVLDE